MATKSTKPKQAEPKGEYAKPHQLMLMATAQNASAMEKWSVFGEVDISELITDLQTKVKTIQDGNMKPVEAMLYGQAIALQTIFTSLARRSAMNAGEYIDAADKYMRLALKAQAQCRATLETLAEIKNPMPYIKQANIANGPQQVNNGAAAGANPEQYAQARPHAGDSQTEQNKLLEHQHGNPLEFGAQGAAGRVNSHMATVG
uniref:Uncharacterized protein n=1 Tax=Polaromonas sp. W9N TaxID=1840323 RepID=A0A2S1FIP3_9BURK|nr:hypothetical protein [Polaromonas sp. W9N]AWD72385.1 hypothetical protein pW9NP1_p006 [Polaromonas sp. W9N]